VSTRKELSKYGQRFDRLQHFFTTPVYPFTAMNSSATLSPLRELRERAGITTRALARQLGIHHTNIVYWEKTGRVARVELLPKLAEALGVTLEELLGQPRPRRCSTAPGKLGQLFEAASRLPRRQQQKIIEFVEPFIAAHNGYRQSP
jgi:transcriptional regulator with XRE-family HTH domain